MNVAYKQFEAAAHILSVEEIARVLEVHLGTIKRWEEERFVPDNYLYDLCRVMLSRDRKKIDQFYTKLEVAKKCMDMLSGCLAKLGVDDSDYTYIEPAAGCGHFFELLPPKRRIGVDINPAIDTAMTADYLFWKPAKGKYIVVGNPPFGLRGNLALRFINHSAKFADVVAFILPQLFESDGKGVAAKRVREYKLALSERLAPNSFERPDGTEVCVNTIFQVWTKIGTDKIARKAKKTCDRYVKIYSLSDGGTPASTRNRDMIGGCDVYIPSTCYRGMRAYSNFYDLPNKRGYGVVVKRDKRAIKDLLMRHDWAKTAFASTNSAINLRSSLIKEVVLRGGFHD